MPRIIRYTLVSARDLLLAAGPFVLLALVLLVGAYFMLKPNPPRKVVLATGPELSDYAAFGERYKAALKQHRIEVVLRQTEGSSVNRRLLHDAKENVDFGFVRGGSSESVRAQEEARTGVPLVALGSLFFEPVWLFYREESAKKLPGAALERIDQLRGWRLNTGGRGSGATNLVMKLLNASDLDRDSVKLGRLDLSAAALALIEGELDAVAIVSAPESQILQMFLRTPGIRLYEFGQAEAYARRFGYMSPVVVPRGVADLVQDVPPRDMKLIAPTAMLVARETTHPALIQLFVQAAHDIHGGPGWFARPGQFPSAQNVEFPLVGEAERYYRTGPPLLQRYLPFWLANLIDRMWVALASIVVMLIPLSRVVPPLYAFRIRSRVFRWYRRLREIEDALSRKATPPAELIEDLDKLDAKAERITVPLSFADELYNLRSHIAMVRERLNQAGPRENVK
jgi:TRAP-type uncharacterized transport system substrate-binding protein